MADPTRPLRYPHTVSFKLDDTQLERAAALRASFESNSWSEAFRWLLDHPATGALIASRVNGSQS